MCASLIFFLPVEYKTYNKSKATSASARKKKNNGKAKIGEKVKFRLSLELVKVNILST
jgi:hypothetical protein